MGNTSWELYCLEHGIEPDGQLPSSLCPLAFPGSWPLASGVWPGYTFPGGAKHVPSAAIFAYDHFYNDEVQHSTEHTSYVLYFLPTATARDGGLNGEQHGDLHEDIPG